MPQQKLNAVVKIKSYQKGSKRWINLLSQFRLYFTSNITSCNLFVWPQVLLFDMFVLFSDYLCTVVMSIFLNIRNFLIYLYFSRIHILSNNFYNKYMEYLNKSAKQNLHFATYYVHACNITERESNVNLRSLDYAGCCVCSIQTTQIQIENTSD